MYYDDDIEDGELEIDIDDGEQDSEEQKARDREATRKAEIDKVPEWVKKEILKGKVPEEDFDRLYNSKRDQERYQEQLEALVKKNDLQESEKEEIQKEVNRLAKLRDDEGNSLGYEQALRYATKGMTEKSVQRDLHIALGGLPEKGETKQSGLRIIPASTFDTLTPELKREYVNKSKKLHGVVKFL